MIQVKSAHVKRVAPDIFVYFTRNLHTKYTNMQVPVYTCIVHELFNVKIDYTTLYVTHVCMLLINVKGCVYIIAFPYIFSAFADPEGT